MNIKKIMAGIMAAAMLFTSAGCSSRSNEKAKEAMEDSFDSYMSRVMNSKDASEYVDANKEAAYDVTHEQEEILRCMLKYSVYTIEESEASAKKGEGSLTIKFKYPDVQTIADSYFSDEMEDLLDDIAHSSKAFFLKKTIDIDMVRDGDDWLVTKRSDAKLKKALQKIVEDIELEGYCGTPTGTSATGTSAMQLNMNKVGISLPTQELMRWREDGEHLEEGLNTLGYDTDLEFAGNDINLQRIQIMGMVESGCAVIIIAAIDPVSLNDVLDMAEENGVTVIAYDRIINDTATLDYYVTFDNYMLGAMQGQYIVEQLKLNSAPAGKVYNIEITAGDPSDPAAKLFYSGAYDVLMPYFSKGVLNVPSDQIDFSVTSTDAWSTDRARGRAENILGTYYSDGAVIDAWLCSNDSTALGVIEALDTVYSGPYPVITGQDCDIANVKNIINGKQAMSVFKDTRTLVDATVKMTDEILKTGTAVVNNRDRYDNGVINVPSYLCSPKIVDAKNYKEILVDSGYYTLDDLGI